MDRLPTGEAQRETALRFPLLPPAEGGPPWTRWEQGRAVRRAVFSAGEMGRAGELAFWGTEAGWSEGGPLSARAQKKARCQAENG